MMPPNAVSARRVHGGLSHRVASYRAVSDLSGSSRASLGLAQTTMFREYEPFGREAAHA
jgi:hypothetical protein